MNIEDSNTSIVKNKDNVKIINPSPKNENIMKDTNHVEILDTDNSEQINIEKNILLINNETENKIFLENVNKEIPLKDKHIEENIEIINNKIYKTSNNNKINNKDVDSVNKINNKNLIKTNNEKNDNNL